MHRNYCASRWSFTKNNVVKCYKKTYFYTKSATSRIKSFVESKGQFFIFKNTQNMGLEFWVIMGLLKRAVVIQTIMAQDEKNK